MAHLSVSSDLLTLRSLNDVDISRFSPMRAPPNMNHLKYDSPSGRRQGQIRNGVGAGISLVKVGMQAFNDATVRRNLKRWLGLNENKLINGMYDKPAPTLMDMLGDKKYNAFLAVTTYFVTEGNGIVFTEYHNTSVVSYMGTEADLWMHQHDISGPKITIGRNNPHKKTRELYTVGTTKSS